MTASLLARVRRLLHEAIAAAGAGTAFGTAVRDLAVRLDEPLRVAIAGRVKAGKSTLLNALVGEELAPTDAGECTRIVTWYRDGHTYRVLAEDEGGATVQVPFARHDGALDVDLRGVPTPRRLVVEWPSASLRTMTLIDTPGVGSVSGAGAATVAALAPEGGGERPADAVVYLMRHLHGDDIAFLEAFHDDTARAAPVNAIGVLSRADEIGAGHVEAMQAAERIAGRYRRDPGVRRLCQTVVPVAGLVAEASGILTERDVDGLRRLAALPAADADALLLSADRFRAAPSAVALDAGERARLLDRLGVFGLRLGRLLVAHQPGATASQVAAELRRHSGLDRLRALLTTELGARGDVLKARSALLGLDRLLREAPPGSARDHLAAELERVRAGAHELAELQAVTALRAGAVPIDEDDAADAERLLATGRPAAARAGLPPDAPADEVHAALAAALARWQRRAEHPLSAPATVDTARVVVRTCEGLIASLAVPTNA